MAQGFFIIVMIVLLGGCGSSNSNKSQEKILNYTTKHTEKPSIKDYNAIGLTSVNASNIDRVNLLLTKEDAENVDSILEIKNVIKKLLTNNIPPKIVVTGETIVEHDTSSEYEDLGAEATDDRDGNITEYIHTYSDVNTSKDGNYTVTYSVEDSAGNETNATREVHVGLDTSGSIGNPDNNDTENPDPLVENNVSKLIVEDAEDGDTKGWIVNYNNSEKEVSIMNKQDNERDSRVIFLDGNERNVGFILQNNWSETKNKVVQWSMKTNEEFLFRVIIETTNGERFLEYNDKDTGTGKFEFSYNNITRQYSRHGLGSTSVDGKWHTYTRDISQDLKRYEPNNKLTKIKEIFVRGKISFDDIIFYPSSEHLEIEKSVEVSAPGVVLTFDDSYVDNWNKIMPYFEEKGVVATFFCNKWASIKQGDLTKSEVSTLKLFENNEHEVGYHTKDHVGTRDSKYNKYTTIQEKANAYFKDQIESGVQNMRTRGFEPESFSYPYISGQPVHNTIIKKTLPHIREFFAYVVLMDEKVSGTKTLKEIKNYLDKFKENKEIGVLLGHWISRPENKTNHTHQVSIERLKKIIEYAKSIGLKFYTLKEAHNIYLNQ